MNDEQLKQIEERAREDQMCGCRAAGDVVALIAEIRRLNRELTDCNDSLAYADRILNNL